jgi:hypothetical protein
LSASSARAANARTLARGPRGGTVDTADLKSASGKPECRFESGRGHHPPLLFNRQAAIGRRTLDATATASAYGNVALRCPLGDQRLTLAATQSGGRRHMLDMRRHHFITLIGAAASRPLSARVLHRHGVSAHRAQIMPQAGLVAVGFLILSCTVAGAEVGTVASDDKFVDELVADLGFQPRDLIERVRYLANVPSEAPIQRRLSHCVQTYADRIATDVKLREKVASEVEQRACARFQLCPREGQQRVDQSLVYAELLRIVAGEMRGEERADLSQVFREHESFVEFGRHLARTKGLEGAFRQASIVMGEVSGPYIRRSCPYSLESWPILLSGLIGICMLAAVVASIYRRRSSVRHTTPDLGCVQNGGRMVDILV